MYKTFFLPTRGEKQPISLENKKKATGYTNQQTSSDNPQTTEMQIQASL